MDNRPFTPRERIEDRRKEREIRRELLKHHSRCSLWRLWALVFDYLAWVKFLSAGYLVSLTQLLKALVLIPKFCNGLIGVSLTDTAPAFN
jgi:hypothetical protein